MPAQRVANLAEIMPAFVERAHKMVWCNVATLDSAGKIRSRVLHPIWEDEIGWITTDPNSPKARHLAVDNQVSLAYVSDVAAPAYADCTAEWVTDDATKQHVWDLLKAAPEPLGFDPAIIYGSIDGPRYGVLRLTPHRIIVPQNPNPPLRWDRR